MIFRVYEYSIAVLCYISFQGFFVLVLTTNIRQPFHFSEICAKCVATNVVFMSEILSSFKNKKKHIVLVQARYGHELFIDTGTHKDLSFTYINCITKQN